MFFAFNVDSHILVQRDELIGFSLKFSFRVRVLSHRSFAPIGLSMLLNAIKVFAVERLNISKNFYVNSEQCT